MNYTTEIKNHSLEYFNEDHVYLCDGIQIPSITQILDWKFKNRYNGVGHNVLMQAAQAGTRVHEAIENYCRTGIEADLPEVQGFKFLQKMYKFEVIANEVPVLLCWTDGTPIAAGRLDLVLKMDGKIGLADIKRTSSLNKNYLAYQLNLYRIAYMQSYGECVDFLRGLHLRNDVRKMVRIPIEKGLTYDLLNEYRKENDNE